LPFARFDTAGTDHIPPRGAAIVAANHRSYFDTAAYAMAVFKAGRNPRGLAKKELFDAPVMGQLMKASGAICVDRKRSGREAYAAAELALRSGEVLIIAPQGTIPRGEAFFDPQLKGKSGAARLAAATGAPVIPLGVWGSEAVWPRSSRVPHITNVLHPPEVRVRVGPPVKGLTGADFEADTRRIMDAIVDLLPPEAKLRRIPSEEELARTFPPGWRESASGSG
jgi:putative phosphoserine phosphatase/1-acylglycerol-3-phosphate O-acyltransferase